MRSRRGTRDTRRASVHPHEHAHAPTRTPTHTYTHTYTYTYTYTYTHPTRAYLARSSAPFVDPNWGSRCLRTVSTRLTTEWPSAWVGPGHPSTTGPRAASWAATAFRKATRESRAPGTALPTRSNRVCKEGKDGPVEPDGAGVMAVVHRLRNSQSYLPLLRTSTLPCLAIDLRAPCKCE